VACMLQDQAILEMLSVGEDLTEDECDWHFVY